MKPEEYRNTILWVDLSRKNYEVEEIGLSKILKFLGGRGLGAKILFDEQKAGIDPLSPENKLIFLAGRMIGTGAPWAPKYCVETKSPLTGTILMSLAGGFFGARLRNTGYDGLIIDGRADEPVYLWIHEGKVEFRKAAHLRGKMTDDCQEAIRKDLGGNKNIQIACIGPSPRASRGCSPWWSAAVVPTYTGWDFPLGKLSPWQPEQPMAVRLFQVGVLKDP